jgi:hypothetical protein
VVPGDIAGGKRPRGCPCGALASEVQTEILYGRSCPGSWTCRFRCAAAGFDAGDVIQWMPRFDADRAGGGRTDRVAWCLALHSAAGVECSQ